MYSKDVFQKMVRELSLQTLVSLAHETLNGIGEEASDKSQAAISNIEVVAAELRRRLPLPAKPTKPPQEQTPPTPRRQRAAATPATQPTTTGGETNVQ